MSWCTVRPHYLKETICPQAFRFTLASRLYILSDLSTGLKFAYSLPSYLHLYNFLSAVIDKISSPSPFALYPWLIPPPLPNLWIIKSLHEILLSLQVLHTKYMCSKDWPSNFWKEDMTEVWTTYGKNTPLIDSDNLKSVRYW